MLDADSVVALIVVVAVVGAVIVLVIVVITLVVTVGLSLHNASLVDEDGSIIGGESGGFVLLACEYKSSTWWQISERYVHITIYTTTQCKTH